MGVLAVLIVAATILISTGDFGPTATPAMQEKSAQAVMDTLDEYMSTDAYINADEETRAKGLLTKLAEMSHGKIRNGEANVAPETVFLLGKDKVVTFVDACGNTKTVSFAKE